MSNYTLASGNSNRSLLVNATTEQASWKRLLRGFSSSERSARVKLRDLWSRLDDREPYPQQLAAIIKSSGEEVDDWRAAVASTPKVFGYGRRRMMRFTEHNTYLLPKTQMNGAHAELYSFCFYHNELPKLAAKGALGPMQVGTYEEVNGVDREPFFNLFYREGRISVSIEVDFLNEHYRVGVLRSKLSKAPHLNACLERLATLKEVDDYFCIDVARGKLQKTLVRLGQELADSVA